MIGSSLGNHAEICWGKFRDFSVAQWLLDMIMEKIVDWISFHVEPMNMIQKHALFQHDMTSPVVFDDQLVFKTTCWIAALIVVFVLDLRQCL